MRVPPLLLLLGLLLCAGAHLSSGQHWSHGWYPGGKRELDPFSASEVRMGICLLFMLTFDLDLLIKLSQFKCCASFLRFQRRLNCVKQENAAT